VSWQPGQDPIPGDRLSCDAIEQVIVPRARDIGGFEVRRALPSAHKSRRPLLPIMVRRICPASPARASVCGW